MKCEEVDDRVWVKLDKALFGRNKDLFIGFFYVPPQGTSTGRNSFTDKWQLMETECERDAALLGDFNATEWYASRRYGR